MGIESDRAAPLLVPELTGTERFEVRRRIGSGSFGIVYEGWDRERQSPVAIKWLSYVDVETIHRFKHEFRSLAEISHPNLVALYDLSSDGDRWFFTMELVRGVGLPEHLRPQALPGTLDSLRAQSTLTARRALASDGLPAERPPPAAPRGPLDVDPGEIRAVFAQLAEGVCALHEAGKLHRDLKCQNVMVTPARRVLLLDFGLVREVAAVNLPADGDIAGTPMYMAPEQCAGAPIGPPADWYAVGVMLFRALTDRFPFDGPTLDVMASKQREEAPRASELVDGVPADLDELCAALLARRPEERPAGPEILRRLGASGARSVAYPPRPAEVFVGRRAELHALELERRLVRQLGPRLVYVHGKSGMGKTALVQAALARAREGGALVLEGRCFERETLPYKALDSVIDNIAAHLRRVSARRVEALVPKGVGDVVRAFPALARVPTFERAATPLSEVPDPQEQRRLAIEAFGDLLRRLARDREVVVFIDDLQWGDRDSATVIARLLEMPDVPVLWLGTYRTDEAASSALLTYLSAATRDGASRIEIRELEERDALALLEVRLGESDTRVLDKLAREVAGSPLLIDLLVRRARADAHARLDLKDVILERLDDLPREARRLLSVLAVGGRPLQPSVAAEVLGVDALDVTALTHASNARLLRIREREEGQALEVYHDRIRETVAAQLSAGEERALHGKLARVLGARGADPERLANHHRGAGELAEALRFTMEAAGRADQALAFERAAELYGIALDLVAQLGARELPDPPLDVAQVRVLRADALRNAGRGAEAARTYLAAASETPRERALRLRRLAGEQYLLSGHVEEGLAVARTILHEFGMTVPEHTAMVLAEFFLRRAQLRVRGLHFDPRDPGAIEDERLELIDLLWAVAGGLAMIEPLKGGIFQARHLLMALELGDVNRVARAVMMEVPFSATAGVPNRARTAELERVGGELAARSPDDYTTGLFHETRGGGAWLEGRWRDALADEERGVSIHRARCTGVAWETTIGTIVLLDVLWRMGRWRELFERYPALLADATSRGDLLLEIYVRVKFRSLTYLAQDRPDEASREGREALARWSQRSYTLLHLWQLFGAVEAHLYAGRAEAARQHLASQWSTMLRSQLLRVQVYAVTMNDLRGRVALACAAEASGRARRELVKEAERAAATLERIAAPWGRGLLTTLRAGIAAAKDDGQRAARLFARAEDEHSSADMELHAKVARARRAALEGDERARGVVLRWIEDLGVARAEPWMALIAPGRYAD